MNHPIENRYRYGLCYDLNGQIVGFNLSPDFFVGLTDEEIERALEAYVKRKHEWPSVQPEPFINKHCVSEQACHEDKMKVLEKIKAEIAYYKDDEIIHAERNEMIDIVLAIIDKHMAESEE